MAKLLPLFVTQKINPFLSSFNEQHKICHMFLLVFLIRFKVKFFFLKSAYFNFFLCFFFLQGYNLDIFSGLLGKCLKDKFTSKISMIQSKRGSLLSAFLMYEVSWTIRVFSTLRCELAKNTNACQFIVIKDCQRL